MKPNTATTTHHREATTMCDTGTETTSPTYPNVTVHFSTGRDGNAFGVIATVSGAIRRQVGHDEARAFTAAAMDSPSYDALLRLCMGTVNVT